MKNQLTSERMDGCADGSYGRCVEWFDGKCVVWLDSEDVVTSLDTVLIVSIIVKHRL